MNRIVRYIQTYLIAGLPFVISCMVWETIQPQINDTHVIASTLRELLGLNLILWFAVLIIFLILLVTVPHIREKTLRRLTNIKERDEREEYITAKASRAAYVSTLSLMIFFLFFSIFSVTIHRLPPEQAVDGKRLALSIDLGFSLHERAEPVKTNKGEIIFNSKHFALSKTAIIFIILSWQLIIFNLVARKELMKGLQ